MFQRLSHWAACLVLMLPTVTFSSACAFGVDPVQVLPSETYLRVVNLAQGVRQVDLYLPLTDEAVPGLTEISFPEVPTLQREVAGGDAMWIPSCYGVPESDDLPAAPDYVPPHCYQAIPAGQLNRPRFIATGEPGSVVLELTDLYFQTRIEPSEADPSVRYEPTPVMDDGVIDLIGFPNAPDCFGSSLNPCSRFFTLVLFRQPDGTLAQQRITAMIYEDLPKPQTQQDEYGIRMVNRAPFHLGTLMASLSTEDDTSQNIIHDSLYGQPVDFPFEVNPAPEVPLRCQWTVNESVPAYCQTAVTLQPGIVRQYQCDNWQVPITDDDTDDLTNEFWSRIVAGRWAVEGNLNVGCESSSLGGVGIDPITSTTPSLSDVTLAAGAYYTVFLGGGQLQPADQNDSFSKERLGVVILQDYAGIPFEDLAAQ